MILVNRNKAEAFVWERLRATRDALLLELDVMFIRAQEVGSDTSDIAEQKQLLRDVTQKDLSRLSIDDLAALTLDQALAI